MNAELSKCSKLPYKKKSIGFYSSCSNKPLSKIDNSIESVTIKNNNVIFFSIDFWTDEMNFTHFKVMNNKLTKVFHSNKPLDMRKHCLKNKDTGCHKFPLIIFRETNYDTYSTKLLLDSLNRCGGLPKRSGHSFVLPCDIKVKGVVTTKESIYNNYYDTKTHLFAMIYPDIEYYELVHVQIRKVDGVYSVVGIDKFKDKDKIIKYCKENIHWKCSSVKILRDILSE